MALSYYDEILLEAGPATNLAQLNAKIQSLVYQPEKLLSIYKKILIVLTGLNTAVSAVAGYHGALDPTLKGATGAIAFGGVSFITTGLIYALKYKIVAFIVRTLCPNLVDNHKLDKEEKLRIVNSLINETKQAMAKVTNPKDKQYCEKALNQLQSTLTQIQQQV